MSSPQTPPRLLTIAGSDSGGGAGIQADLKTFAAFRGYGMSVVTAVTAQNTREVRAVHEIPPAVVKAQAEAVFEDLGVDAVKIGMLGSAAVTRAVAACLRAQRERQPELPVVLDPVMVSKSGAVLLEDDAVEALVEELLPLATVVTPNLPEAARLTGLPVATEVERLEAARQLARRTGADGAPAEGGPAVLLKGGHGEGPEVEDVLLTGEEVYRFLHPRIETRATHGTGCTLSSAIAAGLGAGVPLARAVEEGIDYLQAAIRGAVPLGGGHGPVDHLHPFRKAL